MSVKKAVKKHPTARSRSKDAEKGEAILNAAVKCILTNGFERSSMDEIAKRADVSKQTVYSHFKSKENLFSQAVSMVAARLMPADIIQDFSNLSLEESLKKLGKNFVKLVLSEESYCVQKMINAETTDADKIAQIFYDAGPKTSQIAFEKLIAYWVKKGELEVDDIDLAVSQFLALLKGKYYFERMLGLRKGLGNHALNKHVDASVSAFLKIYKPSAKRKNEVKTKDHFL